MSTSVLFGNPINVSLAILDMLKIGLAVVNFRPVSTWKGEFGFDWFRIGDISSENYWSMAPSGYEATAPTPAGTPSPSITSSRPAVNLTTGKALEKLEKIYQSIPIIYRTNPTNPSKKNYYTSFLKLYTKEASKNIDSMRGLSTYPTGTRYNSPDTPYEAKLQALIEVIEDVDKIELEYNDEYFEIDNPILATNLVAGATSTINIKITCRKKQPQPPATQKLTFTPPKIDPEMGFSKEQEIIAWAYPKDSSKKTDAEQKSLRRRAGRLVVTPNSASYRKHIDIVYVNVRIDVNSSGSPTAKLSLTPDITNHIHHSLHQALIDCNIVEGPDLNMTADPKFKKDTTGTILPTATIIYAKTTNTFVFNLNGFEVIYSTMDPENANIDLYNYLEDSYIKAHPEFKDYFFIFYMDAEGGLIDSSLSLLTLYGQVKKIRSSSVILFHDYQTQDPGVTSHEMLHGLGLGHCFPNKPTTTDALSPEQRFVFGTTPNNSSRDNIMGYNSLIATWKWQWEIINR